MSFNESVSKVLTFWKWFDGQGGHLKEVFGNAANRERYTGKMEIYTHQTLGAPCWYWDEALSFS